jgi:F-type H+-transporting ATPase subunit delta
MPQPVARTVVDVADVDGVRERAGLAFSEAASSGSLGRVRDELFALAALLQRQPRLRKTLGDITVPGEAKQGLVRALLQKRVDRITLRLVESLIGEDAVSWRLPLVLEDVAVQGVLAQADEEGSLDEVEDQLFRFARLLEAQPALRGALTNPVLPDRNKLDLIDDLLGGRAAEGTLILLRHVVVEPGDPVERIEALADRAAARRNRVVVEARTAVEVDDERREKLAEALSRLIGKQVDLEVVVDPEVVGGVVARVGNEIIDGSVKRRLELALEQLTA